MKTANTIMKYETYGLKTSSVDSSFFFFDYHQTIDRAKAKDKIRLFWVSSVIN
jgi:hypothetical protein